MTNLIFQLEQKLKLRKVEKVDGDIKAQKQLPHWAVFDPSSSFMDASMHSMDISTSMEVSKKDPPGGESSSWDMGLKLEENIKEMIADCVIDKAVREVKEQKTS